MKNKKILIIIAVLIILGLATGIIVVKLNSGKTKEKGYKDKIKTLVADFYETDYYLSTQLDTIKEIKDIGVSVTLENLEIMMDKKLDVNCDKEKSYVTIFPEEPFKVKDYKIEYHLDCK